MRYLKLFAKGYLKLFVWLYTSLTIVVLGGIAIYALSQLPGLSVLVCIGLGWFIHKKYEVKVKERARKNKKAKKA